MRLNDETYARLMQIKEGSPDGRVHPQAVVADAVDEASPLHRYFEWDDSKAAERHRLDQARSLLRVAVRVLELEPGKPSAVRVFTRLQDEAGYRATVEVLSDEMLRERMLRTAMAELQLFQKKYAEVAELAEVFSAIERVQEAA